MKIRFFNGLSFFLIVCTIFVFTGCQTKLPVSKQDCSILLDDIGIKSENQLVEFFVEKNPSCDIKKVKRLASYYVEQGKVEGINSDIAWIQMCLETGFLKFGLLVKPEMNNFCGLGAIDKNNPGLAFATEKDGVIAHIQHLHAYGTTRKLNGKLIDSRYKYVNPRGKAPSVYELSGTWASDKQYGQKLANLLSLLSEY